jgi:beta-glucosidase
MKLVLFAIALINVIACAQPYLDPNLAPERRAVDLVSRMTLEEKVLQMQNAAPAISRLNIPAYDWWNEALHGVARAGQATVFPQAIGLAATWDTDLMHRVAEVISTEARAKYNQAIRDADHSRYHGLTFWSPNINIFRDPRWGRGQETYGEDPYLTGQMAIAFIRGMQGDDPHYFKVIATAKHYAVHSGPEPSRHSFDAHPSDRDLNETYLPAFRAAIVEGKADSIMCAYNRVDGSPACMNSDLLQTRLRGEWGFQGYVVSDCGAVSDIFRFHKTLPTASEASAAAVKAGTDLTCGTEYRSLVDAVHNGLISDVEINRSLERLFVARFKLGMFDPPDRVPFSNIPYSVVDSAEHRKLALEAARKSIVLLKNENQTLPLKASIKRIAVIGPAADDREALLGNYNGFSSHVVTPLEGIERQFSSKAKINYALGATYTSQSPAPVSIAGLTAEYFDNPDFTGAPKLKRTESRIAIYPGIDDAQLAAAFPKRGYSVRWNGDLAPPVSGDYTFAVNAGRLASSLSLDDRPVAADRIGLDISKPHKLRLECRQVTTSSSVSLGWIPPAEPLLAQAINAVRNSDAVLGFAGLNPNLEGEEMRVSILGFAGGDRTSLDLPEPQEKLIEAAIATGKPTVVILTGGSAISANHAAQHAAAVLEAWYDGEEIGTAIAETLAGGNNPSGRLPVTFYRSVNDLPPFDDYAMANRTYRYFSGTPLWAFGYGLSYSKFQYSGQRVTKTGTNAIVAARITNVSHRDGDEVAELYVNRELRGFKRVHLRTGESRTIEFDLEKVAAGAKIIVSGGLPPRN